MKNNLIARAGRWALVRTIEGFSLVVLCFTVPMNAQSQQQALQVKVEPSDGSYSVAGSGDAVFHAGVAVHLDGRWVKSEEYPSHTVKKSDAMDDLGTAQQWSVTFSGLSGEPNLISVTSIRPIASAGNSILDLSGPGLRDRVLSDSNSEDRPDITIHDLGEAGTQMYAASPASLFTTRKAMKHYGASRVAKGKFFQQSISSHFSI